LLIIIPNFFVKFVAAAFIPTFERIINFFRFFFLFDQLNGTILQILRKY